MNVPISEVWANVEPIKGELIAFGLTLLGSLIAWYLRPKVKLIWGRPNNSLHMVPIRDEQGNETSKVEIYAEKFFLQNTGRKPATNVEFVFRGNTPDDLSLWQPRQYSKAVSPDGALVINIPFLAPFELVIVDAVYINKRAASVESVKCAEALGKVVNFSTNRNFGTIFNAIGLLLVLFGFAFLLRILGILVFGT